MATSFRLLRSSALYRSEPWGLSDQDAFLNQAVLISTPRMPEDVLKRLNGIEDDFQRSRTTKWGPRTLDLDILLWSGGSYEAQNLVIPHKYLPERAFSLIPACEIAAHWEHPKLQKNIVQLLSDCDDRLEVAIFEGE